MKRLAILLFATALACGCAADGSKHWYDDAVKDWRGDNMQMRNDFATPTIGSVKKPSDS